jgi:protein involved in ribonucleotide reduction
MTNLVYFSSVSGNTKRFIEKLGRPAARIPLHAREDTLHAEEPYVLVVPTYGGGDGKGAVPKQVIKFLNDPQNRALIRGVIAAGNTNFGKAYGLAGDIIAAKTGVPHLYRFEVFGTPDDVRAVNEGLDAFWVQQAQRRTPQQQTA